MSCTSVLAMRILLVGRCKSVAKIYNAASLQGSRYHPVSRRLANPHDDDRKWRSRKCRSS